MIQALSAVYTSVAPDLPNLALAFGSEYILGMGVQRVKLR